MRVDPHDVETLVAALRSRGVRHLSPSDARSAVAALSDDELIAALAACDEPRLRQALTVLLLIRPHLADRIAEVRRHLDPHPALELMVRYTAAVCLQRMWSLRLQRSLGSLPLLPDLFATELGVPSVEEGHGKFALHALAERHRGDAPSVRGRLSEFENAFDMAMADLRSAR